MNDFRGQPLAEGDTVAVYLGDKLMVARVMSFPKDGVIVQYLTPAGYMRDVMVSGELVARL